MNCTKRKAERLCFFTVPSPNLWPSLLLTVQWSSPLAFYFRVLNEQLNEELWYDFHFDLCLILNLSDMQWWSHLLHLWQAPQLHFLRSRFVCCSGRCFLFPLKLRPKPLYASGLCCSLSHFFWREAYHRDRTCVFLPVRWLCCNTMHCTRDFKALLYQACLCFLFSACQNSTPASLLFYRGWKKPLEQQ